MFFQIVPSAYVASRFPRVRRQSFDAWFDQEASRYCLATRRILRKGYVLSFNRHFRMIPPITSYSLDWKATMPCPPSSWAT